MRAWVVVLIGENRQPWDGRKGLTIGYGETAAQAVRDAHPDGPPSIVNVRYAWTHELAEPFHPELVEVDVPRPKWAKTKPANPLGGTRRNR